MLLTPEQWEAVRVRREKGMHTLSLGEYAEYLSGLDAQLDAEYPGVSFGNGRYEVHVEYALRRKEHVPPEILAAVEPSEYFDTPWLAKAKGKPYRLPPDREWRLNRDYSVSLAFVGD